jgi:hypothetical protein
LVGRGTCDAIGIDKLVIPDVEISGDDIGLGRMNAISEDDLCVGGNGGGWVFGSVATERSSCGVDVFAGIRCNIGVFEKLSLEIGSPTAASALVYEEVTVGADI